MEENYFALHLSNFLGCLLSLSCRGLFLCQLLPSTPFQPQKILAHPSYSGVVWADHRLVEDEFPVHLLIRYSWVHLIQTPLGMLVSRAHNLHNLIAFNKI